MTPPAPEPNRRRRTRAVLVAALVCLGVSLAAWYWPPRPKPPDPAVVTEVTPEAPPHDPRVVFPTEFRNVRPEVKFVGDEACARCHQRVARTYREHPMGRSAEWVGGNRGSTDHAAGANNPFTGAGYTMRVERDGDRVWHRVAADPSDDPLPAYSVRADLAIGSGTQGRSYLSVERGAVWQSPVSWYQRGERWNLSPGFEQTPTHQRPVVTDCLRCHTDRPEPVPGAVNRYSEPLLLVQTSIGCERCHGPGELHVAERSAGKPLTAPDHSIVNPAHLSADLKADVCRQCHLQGRAQVVRRGQNPHDYCPGLPWEQFVSTFVAHPDLADARTSVGHFEQFERSGCFAGSRGEMSCVSCHDPHAKPAPADAEAHFRQRCLNCHTPPTRKDCSLPLPQRQAKGDSCVACHMPRRDSANVAHTALTDHRILKRPDSGDARTRRLPPGEFPLVPYRAGPHAPRGPERERDWAIALGNEFARAGASPELWRRAGAKLDEALGRWPGDVPAILTLSRAHAGRKDQRAALEAAQAAAEIDPGSEVVLVQLAGAAVAAGDYELAVRTAGKLVALSPSSADHRLTRAVAYLSLGKWAEAAADCREALAVQPLHPNGRFMLAVCLHKQGDPAAGQRELARALRLAPNPEARAFLSDSYRRLTR